MKAAIYSRPAALPSGSIPASFDTARQNVYPHDCSTLERITVSSAPTPSDKYLKSEVEPQRVGTEGTASSSLNKAPQTPMYDHTHGKWCNFDHDSWTWCQWFA